MSEVKFVTVDDEAKYAVVPIALWKYASALLAEKPYVPGPAPDYVETAVKNGLHPLRAWRLFKRMKATELAKLSGLSHGYISLIECGHRLAPIETLSKLALALDIEVSALIHDTYPEPDTHLRLSRRPGKSLQIS
jgi:DNA-binding Xre family transcriptional regulator